MDLFLNVVIILIMLFFAYLLIKPKKAKAKPSTKKKEELVEHYRIKLRNSLDDLSGDERKYRKTELLKLYAKELEFNIFFDEAEVKNIIKELATI